MRLLGKIEQLKANNSPHSGKVAIGFLWNNGREKLPQSSLFSKAEELAGGEGGTYYIDILMFF